MISGTTSHRLTEISRYSTTQPFLVGVNGVTNITYNSDGTINQIYYTLDGINYITSYFSPYPTIFYTNLVGNYFQTSNLIKEETKMNTVFPPKIDNQIFIERMSLAVFERHTRLSNITNIGSLTEYRNGYYRIVQNI